MSLLDAPIWHDPATWIVLGVSLLFLVVGFVMYYIIMKVVRGTPPPELDPLHSNASNANSPASTTTSPAPSTSSTPPGNA